MTTKLTRQGVRDLNHLPSKPRGRRLELPPQQTINCKHPNKREVSLTGETYCLDCGKNWDWDGKEY